MLRTILVCFVISSLCFSCTYGSCALSAKTIHLNNMEENCNHENSVDPIPPGETIYNYDLCKKFTCIKTPKDMLFYELQTKACSIQESATDVPEECKVVEVPPCGIMIVLKADESQPCPVQTVNGK